MRIVDFHTHRLPEHTDAEFLLSVSTPPSHKVRYSLELHPWHLPAVFSGLPPGWTVMAENADAIGEIGLDRLRGPDLSVQRRYLTEALNVAAELHKPVVLHCVRAWQELRLALRPFTGLRCLCHGFRGKPALREELEKQGFFVSSAFPEALRNGRRIGLESDDGPLDIDAVYARAETVFEPGFEARLAANFACFLKGE